MLPDHIDPFVFWIVVAFAVAFSGVGLFMLFMTLRVRRNGSPAQLRLVDFEVHIGGEGEGYQPVYEVLDGPRAGSIVRSDNFSSRSQTTLMTSVFESREGEKLKKKIGQERRGWVHHTEDRGMSGGDLLRQILLASAFCVVGFGATAIILKMLFG